MKGEQSSPIFGAATQVPGSDAPTAQICFPGFGQSRPFKSHFEPEAAP